MRYVTYPHRYADIILNSDYEIKKEIERSIEAIDFDDISEKYNKRNVELSEKGKRGMVGMQKILNEEFRGQFLAKGWEGERSIFSAAEDDHDLRIDFWKRNIGVDVAFNHRSFIGGDLLRLQAAAEVQNIITVGVYICSTKTFLSSLSKEYRHSLVSYERTKWYLDKFYPVLTVPIMVYGIDK